MSAVRIEERLGQLVAKLHDDANALESETASKVSELRSKAESLAQTVIPAAIRNLPDEAHQELVEFFQKVHGVL